MLGIITSLTKVTYLENFLAFEIILHIDHYALCVGLMRKCKEHWQNTWIVSLRYVVDLISVSLKMLNFSIYSN